MHIGSGLITALLTLAGFWLVWKAYQRVGLIGAFLAIVLLSVVGGVYAAPLRNFVHSGGAVVSSVGNAVQGATK